MYNQGDDLLANEEALNSDAVRVLREVDAFCGEVRRLQETWRESFEVDRSPRVNQISQNFFWAALTNPANNDDDIFPHLEETLQESLEHSEETLEPPAGPDHEIPPPPEPEISRGSDTRAEPPPEEGASSINNAATQGNFGSSFDTVIQTAIHRICHQLLQRSVYEDLCSPPTETTASTDVNNEAPPESGNAASTTADASATPNSGIPIAGKAISPRRRRNWKLVNRKLQQKKLELRSEENAARTMDVTNDGSIDNEHESDRTGQPPIEDSSDTVDSKTRVRPMGPGSSSAVSAEPPPTPSSDGPRGELRRSTSTPQLHQIMQGRSVSPENTLRRGAAERQSMRPWLESNASALVQATNRAKAPSRTPPIPNKSMHVQALFYDYIDCIHEEIEEIRQLAIRSNTSVDQYLIAAMKCLGQAKSEMGVNAFKPWDRIDFLNPTRESNQRAWLRARGNAIITGVPVIEFENVLAIVKRIGLCLGRPVDYQYVKDAFRLDEKDPSSPILVKFTYTELKDALVKASSTSELYANQIDKRIRQRSRVSVQDQLTPLNIYLFEKAKVLKDNGCINLWVDKGNIWVKKKGSLNADQLDSKAKLLILLREFRFNYQK